MGQRLAVFVLDQIGADRPAWAVVDFGDGGRQFAGKLNSQAWAGFALNDPLCTVPDVGAIGFT